MYFCLCGTSYGLTQTECNRFHTPVAGADATQVDLGACTDVDWRRVQDQIDNCPGAANNPQTDANGDGIGDVCEDGCGNDILDSGEECDVSHLDGETCVTQGYPGGTLRCRLDCTFDESDCIGGPTKTATPTPTRTPLRPDADADENADAEPHRPTRRRRDAHADRTSTPTATADARLRRHLDADRDAATADRARRPRLDARHADSQRDSDRTATRLRRPRRRLHRHATATATSTATASTTATATTRRRSSTSTATAIPRRSPTACWWCAGCSGSPAPRWSTARCRRGCTRCTAPEIEARLAAIGDQLDIDGDGELEPLTDGVLVLRWLFGFRGDQLTASAVDQLDCTRCTAAAIESYLAGLS